MGFYLNLDGSAFEEALLSEIYVDKTELIAVTNSVLRTKNKYMCVSRPRRFGKTMTLEMLEAYYTKGINAAELFKHTKIYNALNHENALSYTISLALYSARKYYTIIREMPAGKGFADLIFIPNKNNLDKPALVVELKWDKTVRTAIDQIKNKQYTKELINFAGNIILVGITYNKDVDKEKRTHSCIIEKINY